MASQKQTAHSHTHAEPQSSQGLGQRNTRQREIIVSILDAADGPMTIPEIHLRATKAAKKESLGIATVYRTINLLVENKLARTIVMPTGETRYEHDHHDGHHDHFQCRLCQHVYDLDHCPVGLPDGARLPGGFMVESHELTLIGLCGACAVKPGQRKKT